MNNQYIEYVIWGVKPDDKNKPAQSVQSEHNDNQDEDQHHIDEYV